ncbi:PBSX family phage terminase large subunit [Lachnospiraceae bacterium WCA3-601-WT-6H]|uniref:PBSX family phage terminase large subunit n=2 Tax=Waltera intestinalis TaxID=2606635 RepID=A0A6L5YJQ3_9FIRM|nr:PBSX family phage terminase large subunit [Waltera intestinalis]
MLVRYRQKGFEFKPFSEKQKKVLTWWCKDSPVREKEGIIADGAIRSGKTLCMSLSFVIWAMSTFNMQNLGMAGKTIGSFRRNVLFWLKLMLKSRGYQVSDHRSDNMIVISKGDVTNFFYIFGGKDERSQDLIQGITLAGMFFDEVALMPESFVNQATGRCSVSGSKFWFNCNPDSPSHWFKTNWIDDIEKKKLIYLHFTMDDNLSLTKEIKDRYKAMYSGVFYSRYILGLWVIAEGLVYGMFNEERNVFHGECEYSGQASYYLSIDYGTMNPFAVGLMELQDSGRVRMLREGHYSGREKKVTLDNEAYYQIIKDVAGDFPITSIVIDPSAAAMKATIQKYGEYTCTDGNNDVLNGIQEVTKYLNLGMLQIHDSCVETKKEFGAYAWDDKAVGEDRVIKENDHHMDLIRYFIYTVARRYNRGLI